MKKITIEQREDDGWILNIVVAEGDPEPQVTWHSFTDFGVADSSNKTLLGFVQNYFEQNG